MTIRDEIGGRLALEAMNAKQRSAVDIGDLLTASYGRVVINECLRKGAYDQTLYRKRELRHIVDWLVAAKMRGEPWLARVDDKGRPVKLMKFGSVEQIIREADKAMAKWRNEGVAISPDSGAKVVRELPDGYRIVKLTTPEALDHEGREMGHCVGHGSYDQDLSTNFKAIYSLRDRFNKSHVTIEIDNTNDIVEQISGKQNEPPLAEYTRRLCGWIGPDMKFPPNEMPWGFAMDSVRGLVELAALKPGDTLDIRGRDRLTLRFTDAGDAVLPFPENLTILGNVLFQGSDIIDRFAATERLDTTMQRLVAPAGLDIRGEAIFRHLAIDSGTFVADRANFSQCELATLPTSMRAAAFNGCTFRGALTKKVAFEDLVSIWESHGTVIGPDARFVDLHVDQCCQKGSRPFDPVVFESGVSVFRDLTVFHSDVQFKGALEVIGNMSIAKSDFVAMPDELRVEGDLTMDDCAIDRWPGVMDVGGNFSETKVASREPEQAPTRAAGMR